MTALRRLGALLVVCVLATVVSAKDQAPPAPEKTTADKPLIQIAILLDTSSSMSGLINQARAQLWTIVNEFARSKQGGLTPRLEVALYEYGNSTLSAGEGCLGDRVSSPRDEFGAPVWSLRRQGASACEYVLGMASRSSSCWSSSRSSPC